MQSKPGSANVIYLNFDGETIIEQNPYFGWTWFANQYDIDGSTIQRNNKVSSIKVPPAPAGIDRVNILKQVAIKYDIFDVNITDEKGVYDNSNGFKTMVIITHRPTISVYNQLTTAQDKSENGLWPYSYRRFLRYREINGYWPEGDYRLYTRAGLAGPPNRISLWVGGLTNYIFVWVNIVYPTGLGPQLKQTAKSDEIQPTNVIARTTAHEVGHKFGLDHDGQLPNIEYYKGHPGWAPIMGADDLRNIQPLSQWSKLEYDRAEHVYVDIPMGWNLGGKQDDLIIIGNHLGFIKPPKDSLAKTAVRARDYEEYETTANIDRCWSQMDNLGVYTRVISQSDVITFNSKKVIEGMIGFPGDFEIIKMLLTAGTYNFTIDPIGHNPESMLDVSMSIMNCHCHKPKETYPVNCNEEDLPTRYPTNVPLENFQCISFDNCLDKYKYDSYITVTPYNNQFGGSTITLTLPYTQIVYLLIAGDKQIPFENGWSVYSSVGKYYLEIVKDGNNNPQTFLQQPSTAPLPVCNCEEFTYCNSDQSVLLFTQEEVENIGTQNQAGAHIKEYDIIIDGKTEKRKFLVYGAPIEDLNTDCPDGKFCLAVYDSQLQKCVKQELVVGSVFEKKKEIQ